LERILPKGMQGRKVGHYTLLEQIGQGGMGEVFSAVRSDGQFDHKVAIKLVRSASDSAAVLDRFRNERQILAGLDHVNIARLLDGGTTEQGEPFFAMEFVSGSPIDTYCDVRKLPIPKRLVLFRQVCSAVQYAHQHLVIHRDIKPGNILVTEDGTPKLLDFGIARILDASGSLEATQFRSFTPDYASPEQLRGDSISTASDLYSLGVVLYQLLTGRFPHRVEPRTPARLANAIATEEPERPSTSVVQKETVNTAEGSRELLPEFFADTRETTPLLLQHNLRGDLDFILLKALRKEPEQRYSSAEQFSEDIRNHLEKRPVSARKGTWTYYTAKFLRRHRAGVAAAALVLAALIAGVGVTLREARIAEENRRKADARFNDVRKLANSLLFEVHDSIQNLPGATDSRKLILQKAIDYLDSLAADAQNDPGLTRDLIAGYSRIAELEGNPSHPNLGDTKASLASYKKSIDLEEALVRAYPDSDKDQLHLAQLYLNLSEVHMGATGNLPEAIRLCRLSLPIFDGQAVAHPKDVTVLTQATRAYVSLGMLQIGNGLTGSSGTVEAGVEALEKALEYNRRSIELAPENINFRGEGGGIRVTLGDAYLKLGNRPLAEENFRSGLKILTALDPKEENIRISINRGVTETKVGDALMLEGRYPEALDYYKKGLETCARLHARDPHNETVRSEVVVRHGQVALALAHLGRNSEADQEFRAALLPAPNDAEMTSIAKIVRAIIGIWFGQALQHQGKITEAAQEFGKSKAIIASLGGGVPLDPRTKTYLSAAEIGLGSALTAQGKFADAQKELRTSTASLESLANEGPPQQELLYTLAESYNGEGVLFSSRARKASGKAEQLANWKSAEGWFQKSLATWDKVKNPAHLSTIGFEVSMPEEVSRRLAECNSQVKLLEAPPK